jgi:hypothetical protein
MVTGATASGWLSYAAADVGYNVVHGRDYKVGPFVGYSYFRQNVNAFGCTQFEPVAASCADGNQASLTQDETWQSLRVGFSAVATIWDRWGIDGDVAYLPYSQYSGLDSHWLREPVAFFPQDGRGRGVQTELILTYLVTENLKLGIGGRYWAMWTTSASQSCNGGCIGASSSPPAPYTANTERFGTFVPNELSVRFASVASATLRNPLQQCGNHAGGLCDSQRSASAAAKKSASAALQSKFGTPQLVRYDHASNPSNRRPNSVSVAGGHGSMRS